jgi:hypothetical protein
VAATAISGDGLTITLSAPLVSVPDPWGGVDQKHPGARDGNNAIVFLPHVANRTRSTVIKSENAAGTRGHVMCTGHCDIDVRYTVFAGLGPGRKPQYVQGPRFLWTRVNKSAYWMRGDESAVTVTVSV